MALVGAAIAALLLGFAGVVPEVRALAHLLIAGALGVAVVYRPEVLARSASAVRFALAGLVLAAAIGTGLLPIPAFLGRWIAPSWADDRGALGWDWSSLAPERTLGALAGAALVTGLAYAVGLLALGRPHGAARLSRTVLGVTAGVAAFGLAHAATDNNSLFGLISSRQSLTFFAPFINANHFGSFLLLGLPVAIGRVLDDSVSALERGISAIVAVFLGAMIVLPGAAGPILVAGLQIVAAGVLWRPRIGALFGLLAVPALVIGVGATWASLDDRSLHGRVPIWIASVWMWADHWLLGTGTGAFWEAIEPYRTDREAHGWPHAHNDWLEWWTDTGLVGLVALGVALALVAPRPPAAGATTGRFALLGVAGVLAHALLDFPLHIPAIAACAAAVAAWRAAAVEVGRPAPVWLARALAVGLAAAQLPAAAWQVRTGRVDAARTVLAESLNPDEPPVASAARTLRWLAPGDGSLAVLEARQLAVEGDRDAALEATRRLAEVHRRDARIQRAAITLFGALGAPDEALAAAERATTVGPADVRNWTARAEALSAHRPEDGPQAWVDAWSAGDPTGLNRAWAALPVGVVWVDRVEGLPAKKRTEVADFLLSRGDAEAAALAYESALRSAPGLTPPGYARALLATGRDAEADAFLARAVARRPDDVALIRALATRRSEVGDWKEARDLWKRIAKKDPEAFTEWIRAIGHLEGPEEALAELQRMRVSGKRLSFEQVLLQSELEALAGRPEACVTALMEPRYAQQKRYRKDLEKARSRCRATAPGG